MIKILKLIDALFDLLFSLITGIFKIFFGKKAEIIILLLIGAIIYVTIATGEFIVAGIAVIIFILFLSKGGKRHDF